MSYVIKIQALVGQQLSGQPAPVGYIESCDLDFADGLGTVDVTASPHLARQFESLAAAIAYWQATSPSFPVRPDGRPNRPLTVYTVEFEHLEDWD